MDPKIINYWTSFGSILGPELVSKGDKNGTTFGTLFPRLSGVGELRFCELNRRGGIAMATGIIFDKRKGGIAYMNMTIWQFLIYFMVRKHKRMVPHQALFDE